MRRMSRVGIALIATGLCVAGCAPHPVSIAQLDTVPASVNVGGGFAVGGEPGVGWGPRRATFYVASPATGICIGVPTSVVAHSSSEIDVAFSRSSAMPCPDPHDVAWQLTTPRSIDTRHPVSVIIRVPNDGSIADDGTFRTALN